MATVFSDTLFKKTTLSRIVDGDKWEIIMTLKPMRGTYDSDVVRQDSKGTLLGRVTEIWKNGVLQVGLYSLPDWVVPGTIFQTIVNGSRVTLTLESTIQTRIDGIYEELGDKHTFSYMQVSEFDS
jgi:hypothetical protein